jgi:long-chain acyl-CoA synthetase
VPLEVARDFEDTFGGEVYEGYGLTELSGIATTYVQGQPRKPGSVGMPLEGTQLRIVDVDGTVLSADEPGEVELRGPSVIPGYWDDEGRRLSFRDGWLATGDVGYVDEDGYLSSTARGRDHPRRLQRLPARGRGGSRASGRPEAAVVAVPHPRLRRSRRSWFPARDDTETDALREHARARRCLQVPAVRRARRVASKADGGRS